MAAKTDPSKDESLPSPETARAAYAPALESRQKRVLSALHHLTADPPQVLILEGGSAEQRYSVALWYAARLNCPQPETPCLTCSTCLQIGAEIFNDLYVLDGRNGSIKIDEVRELRRVLGEAPRGEGMRVVVLAEAQALGNEAANALLKSLEEPRPGICFLLLTPQRERLLPTLVSRGWVLTLAWPDPEEPTHAAFRDWEDALATFAATGQGWMDRISAKGSVDATLARQLVVTIQKAQTATLAQRSQTTLSKQLRVLRETDHIQLADLLAQCQESLDFMVSPQLVLGWLGTQLYVLCRRARQHSPLPR